MNLTKVKQDLEVLSNLTKSLKSNEMFDRSLGAQAQAIIDRVEIIRKDLDGVPVTDYPYIPPANPNPSESEVKELDEDTKKLLEQFKDKE